jgi:hypothetical protein
MIVTPQVRSCAADILFGILGCLPWCSTYKNEFSYSPYVAPALECRLESFVARAHRADVAKAHSY